MPEPIETTEQTDEFPSYETLDTEQLIAELNDEERDSATWDRDFSDLCVIFGLEGE